MLLFSPSFSETLYGVFTLLSTPTAARRAAGASSEEQVQWKRRDCVYTVQRRDDARCGAGVAPYAARSGN